MTFMSQIKTHQGFGQKEDHRVPLSTVTTTLIDGILKMREMRRMTSHLAELRADYLVFSWTSTSVISRSISLMRATLRLLQEAICQLLDVNLEPKRVAKG